MKVSQIPLMPVGGKNLCSFRVKKKGEKKDLPNLMQLETLKPIEEPT